MRMATGTTSGVPKRKSERGASLVEAALVTPVFFLVVFGILEIGFLFRDYLAVSNAATQGARAASVAGNDKDADFLVLSTVAHGIAAVGPADTSIEYVVVFKPEANGSIPAGCDASNLNVGGVAGKCNLYEGADFNLDLNRKDPVTQVVLGATGNWGCDPVTGQPAVPQDSQWCPKIREASLSGNGGTGPDEIGIHVVATHNFVTGFFQTSTTLNSTRIIRIEPSRN